MRLTWKNITLALFIAVLFVPLVVFSPETVTDHLVAFFNIRYPEPPPQKFASGQKALAAAVRASISEADVKAHLTRLTSSGSRVVGYPGHEAAYHYIKDAFQQIGLEQVTVEAYDVTVPIDKGCSLKILGDSRTIPLYAVWPNLVRTSTLPGKGLQAPLVDGGSGEFSDFNGKDLQGSVVLMSFNSWNRWMNASMLGAKAVIFVGPDSTTTAEAEQKFFQVPLNVPRFWIGRQEGEALRRRLSLGERIEVEVKGRMVWEKHKAHNVFGRITGRHPRLKDEIVLFDAYYDAMSVVPALAPGAEQASGLVALLELAEYLKAHPPAHTVLFLATSAHHMGFRGVCDFLGRHARKEEHFAPLMTDPIDIRLWVSLDLSSHTDQIGVWNGSSSFYYQRFFTPLGKMFSQLGAELAPAFGLNAARSLVDGINPPSGMSWRMFIPGGRIKTDSEVVLTAGMPTLAFVTINDARFRVDTPFDTVEGVNIPNLTNQTQLLTGVFSKALDDPYFLPDYKVALKDRMRALKGRILTFPRRSITPDRPRKGAIVALRMSHQKSVKGVRTFFYDVADENGEFFIPGLAVRWVGLSAYYLDPETGDITYAPDRGQASRIYKPEFGMDWWITRATRILFPCISTDFYDTVDPRYLTKLSSLSVYGDGNVAPQEYGYTIGYGRNEPVGVVFTRPNEKVKLVMRSGQVGIRYLLINATDASSEEIARGDGFTTITHGAITHTAFQAASDMWILNEARMRELRAYGIENFRLNTLHEQAAKHLDRARSGRKDLRWDDFVKHSRAALGLESRAYPDVKSTQNDVIHGIVFFMALVIPCAFFAERLIFTASDIRWMLTGFTGIFVVIWIFLSLVHPAFDLSNPFVVLLAFILLALACFVISIVFSRFNANMRNLRTEAAVIHDVDVGRVSASVAAFQLGIANMKRRKLRTVLTFSTLVLLTFTVLSFTSIKSLLRFHQIARDNQGTYPGMLIRSKYWAALEESVLDYAQATFEGEAVVAPRSWYADKSKKTVQVEHRDKAANALGVLGLSAQESEIFKGSPTRIQDCLSAGRWFREGERKVAVVPEEMAKLLDITSDDVGRTQVPPLWRPLHRRRHPHLGPDGGTERPGRGNPDTCGFRRNRPERLPANGPAGTARESRPGGPRCGHHGIRTPRPGKRPDRPLPDSARSQQPSPGNRRPVPRSHRGRRPYKRLHLPALRGPLRRDSPDRPRRRNRTHPRLRLLLAWAHVASRHQQPLHPHRHRRPHCPQHHDGVCLRTVPRNRHLLLGRTRSCTHRLPLPGRVLCLRRARSGIGLPRRSGRRLVPPQPGHPARLHPQLLFPLCHGLLRAGHARGYRLHRIPRAPGVADGRPRHHPALEDPRPGRRPVAL